MPTVEQIIAKIIEVLRTVQDSSGQPWIELDDLSRPMDLLDGFDSHVAVEATVLLETEFSITIKRGNIFAGKDHKPASLREIALEILAMLGAGQAK